MAIRVTCPGCHTRFEVSDKFAGKEGPCPKCKKVILVPDKDSEVVIHTPDEFGPKDQSGRATLKPITRKDTKVTPLGITLVLVPIAGFLLLALITQLAFPEAEDYPIWLVAIGALAIAVPSVVAGYSFMRDQERGSFIGKELWIRVAICAAIYAFLWTTMPLAEFAFDGYTILAWITALVAMFAIGAAVSMYTFELDYLVGLLHVGMYIACAIAMRICAGIGAMPGAGIEQSQPAPPVNEDGGISGEGGLSLILDQIQQWVACLC